MNRKLACTILVAAVGVALSTSANAAPPKGFSKTVSFTDSTPDPTGNAGATNQDHCSGKLPQEAPLSVKIPGAGSVDINIDGFQGDWALQIKDASGEIIAGDDQNPPNAFESTSVSLKKAATIQILPCNLEGTPQANVHYTYTPKRK
jgi:hypothetical protein